jgi:hypothetical protein
MRWCAFVAMMLTCAALASAGDVIVQKVQGDVLVRQGVTEIWNAVAAGDILKPNDTMRTGKRAAAVLVMHAQGKPDRKISLPADVLVDVSDIRDLTQEELMLKLTMAKVRASSYEWKDRELQIPNATVVHGQDKGGQVGLQDNLPENGTLQWNGVRVLVDHGFTSTGVLRMMEVFRSYPSLAGDVEHRLAFADALEKVQLRGEALTEYGSLSQRADLTQSQRMRVESRLSALQK